MNRIFIVALVSLAACGDRGALFSHQDPPEDPSAGKGNKTISVVHKVLYRPDSSFSRFSLNAEGTAAIVSQANTSPGVRAWSYRKVDGDGNYVLGWGLGAIPAHTIVDAGGPFSNPAGIHQRPDGRIITVGTTWADPQQVTFFQFTLSGAPDTTFYNNGGSNGLGDANASALQSDGKLIIVGQGPALVAESGDPYDVYIRRYLANGLTDSSFPLRVDDGLLNDSAREVAVSTGGVIAVTGDTQFGFGGNHVGRIFLHRGSDGALIQTLTSEFYSPTPSDPNGLFSKAVFDAQERLYSVVKQNAAASAYIYRYLPVTFFHDTTWNAGNGVALPPGFEVSRMLPLPDGKLLVAGTDANGAAVHRYLPNGAVDPSFGTAGTLRLEGAGMAHMVLTATAIVGIGEGSDAFHWYKLSL